MCEQCMKGNHDKCLGVVYDYEDRGWRGCGCDHA